MSKISIVLPVYNGEKYLAQAIESIIAQEFKEWELIIVNDCSEDATQKVIDEFKKKDKRIVSIQNESNMKLPASLNIGFAKSTGKYLTWTSDDNILGKNALLHMYEYLEDNPQISFVYGDTYFINDVGERVGKSSYADKSIYYENCVGAYFMYRRDVYQEVGEYRTDKYLVEDYEYWLRISKKFQLKYINQCEYYYRIHEKSLTQRKRNGVRKALFQLRKENFSYLIGHLEGELKEKFLGEMIVQDSCRAKEYYYKWISTKEKFEKLEALFPNGCFCPQKKIILFGAGIYGQEALKFLGDDKVYCFVDNSKELQKKMIKGKTVIGIEQLEDIHEIYNIVITVDQTKSVDIAWQLWMSGIHNYIFGFDVIKEREGYKVK